MGSTKSSPVNDDSHSGICISANTLTAEEKQPTKQTDKEDFLSYQTRLSKPWADELTAEEPQRHQLCKDISESKTHTSNGRNEKETR